jgi:carbamoyltransferase
MLLIAQVREQLRQPVDWSGFLGGDHDLMNLVNQRRSPIPSVTHVDYSARIQTVDQKRNPAFHRLLQRFFEITGCPVLINTSFNVRGEPIVCTPADAAQCFINTGIDLLAMGGFLIFKQEQTDAIRSREGKVLHEAD